MNRRQIGLKLVLSELGMKPTMQSFEERLVLQKVVYLAQQMGVTLGYHFSWYLRGPYSKDLTADAFSNLTNSAPEGWILDTKTKEKLNKVKSIVGNIEDPKSLPRELEKLASVLFVIKTGQATESESITSRMKAAGKDFNQQEVDDAIRTLREFRVV
jgi:uncharacterized protein YwgA